MPAARGGIRLALLLALLAAAGARGADEPALRVELTLDATEATVGERVPARLTVDGPAEVQFVGPAIGPRLGPFEVVSGGWSGPQPLDGGGGSRWTWRGSLSAFRTGELEVPPIAIRVEREGGAALEASTEPVAVRVRSVIDGADGADLADLKPPAGIPADYRTVVVALVGLALLLAAAALLWWLQRRFAGRLAAVPAPDDPFHRIPPHEWVYAELQKLLARRLAEQGQVDVFFAEISRIVKRYLGGRFRTELLEQTTDEVPPRLRQAGAPDAAIGEVTDLLAAADRVKFAGERPDAGACRQAIEAAYRIVDATRPRDAARAERGAA